MKIKKYIIRCWWSFPVLLAFFILTLCLLFTTVPSILETIVFILLFLTLLALPVSWIILLVNRQWLKCLMSLLASVLVVFVLWIPFIFFAMSGPDGFGREHPIPEGLEYNLPLSADSNLSIPIDSLDTDTYLQVWTDSQGGMYMYDLYYAALPAGEIFLRCYEATKNIPLSEERILAESRVSINPTTSFSKLVSRKRFTIYEGDWEDYYAARIEVWHRNAETKQEMKLTEKIYRVDGWMR